MKSAAEVSADSANVQVVAIMGPTASGKTSLAVALARRLGGELVNADSRQAIAELAIGVCKPTAEQLQGVTCHGLDWSHVGQPFSVAEYVQLAGAAVESIAARGHLPLVVGGTGLYVRSLLQGFDFGGVPPDPEGAKLPGLADSGGQESVASGADLASLDPERAETIDLHNPRRVRRALELARQGAWPGQRSPGWRSQRLACRVDPARLRTRIEARSERLIGEGLVAEVERLLRQGFSAAVLSHCAIGYAEVLDWLGGSCQRDEAVERVILRTRHYAKAQMTWLRSEPDLLWVDAGASPDELVSQCLAEIGRAAA